MKNTKTSKAVNYSALTYLSISLLAFIYVLARAFLVGITFDESYSIGVLVSKPFIDVLNYNFAAANNHLINSILIKLIYLSGFDTTFALRLPNLLSMPVYLFFAYRICCNYFDKRLGLCLFLLLVSNPFVLDFFGLARGYGLALSCTMASLYYLLEFNKELKRKDSIKALILGSLAVLCNFAFLFFWLSLFVVIQGITFVKDKKIWLKVLQISLGIGATLGAIIYSPISKLRAAESLWYGGTQNSYSDTLNSLMNYSLAQATESATVTVVLNVFLLLLLALLALFFFTNFIKKTKLPLAPLIFITLFLGPLAINTFLHYTLDTKYLINRTAIFLLPISMLTIAFFVQYNCTRRAALFSRSMFYLLVFSSLVNFGRNANLQRTINWYYDAAVPEVLSYINERGKKEGKIFILDSTNLFSSSIQYYKWKKQYEHVVYIKDLTDNLDKSHADYFLFLTEPQDDIEYDPSLEESLRYPRVPVLSFEKEKTVLWSNLRSDNLTVGH